MPSSPKPRAARTTSRVEMMLVELCRASAEYTRSKQDFDAARIAFESARERFTSVRRLAKGVLAEEEWWQWRAQHESVQYVGLKIGDAIALALENRAFEAAEQHVASESRTSFDPGMRLEEIQEVLEEGGFEFRSSTPLREVNAALINLEEKKKRGDLYESADAQTILEIVKPQEPAERNEAKAKTA